MSDVGMKIKIGADLSEVDSAIKKLTGSLQTIPAAGAQAASGLNKIPQALRDVSTASERMRNAVNGPAGAFKNINNAAAEAGNTLKSKLTPGANQAALALTNVGRVAQDLPFGFIGIQNNLNPLLESFQRLKAETGSSKLALKALGSSLIGAGGIGLALSVVSSAFLIFGNSTRGAKKELEGFDKALEDSNKKAGEELARVQVLNAVITDNTRKQTERKKAASELSDILKDLNINLSKEAILNGQVAEATKLATNAIIERAKARAAEARIGELSGQQLQRDLKRIQVSEKLTKAEKDLATQEKIRQQTIGGGSVPGIGGNTAATTQRVISLQSEIKDLDKATSEANKEIAFLIGQISSNDLTIETKGGKTEKEVDLLKQRIAALKEIQSIQGLDAKQQVELVQLEIKLINRDGPKLGFKPEEIKQQSDAILEAAFPVKTFIYDTIINTRVNKLEPLPAQKAQDLTRDFKTNIAKAIGIDGKPLEIPAPKLTFTNLGTAAADALAQLNASINSIVGNIQVEAFSTIGEAIGTALTGGDVGKVFINFFGILADGLQSLGKALIAYGVALLGFKVAMKSLNPVVALVAGVAAVAAGVAVKASLPKFAEGGIVTGPVIGQIGEMHKPEVIMPLDRLKAFIGSGFGNNNNGMQLIPIINNEGLFLAMKRGERSAGRKF
jgi:hypothetical protein